MCRSSSYGVLKSISAYVFTDQVDKRWKCIAKGNGSTPSLPFSGLRLRTFQQIQNPTAVRVLALVLH